MDRPVPEKKDREPRKSLERSQRRCHEAACGELECDGSCHAQFDGGWPDLPDRDYGAKRRGGLIDSTGRDVLAERLTVIKPSNLADDGKKGPWVKFDSYEQAERVLRALPFAHAHPQVLAFVSSLRDEIERFNAQTEGRLRA